MNIFGYNVPVDKSYRTGWYKYPDREPIFYRRNLPDIPLRDEMTLDVPIDEDTPRGGFNYLVVEANFSRDNRGYFIDNIEVYPAGSSKAGVIRLTLTIDIWVTSSILNQVQWQGKTCRLPNPDIATGLAFVQSNVIPPKSSASALIISKYTSTRLCVNAVLKSVTVSGESFNATILSPPFDNYTDWQIIYNKISNAGYLMFGSDGRYWTIDTINGGWFIPNLSTLEIDTGTIYDSENDTYLFKDVQVAPVRDRPVSGGGSVTRDWILLGNLLQTEYIKLNTFLSMGVDASPRVCFERVTTGGYLRERNFISVGNSINFITYPCGEHLNITVSLTLQSGSSPCDVKLEVNGERINMTPSLATPIFSLQSRVTYDANILKYALNGVGSVLATGASFVTGSGNGMQLFGLANTLLGMPQNSTGGQTGDGNTAIVINLNDASTFTGTITAWKWNQDTSEVPYSSLVNELGDRYSGKVAFNFFYSRPPVDYATTGIFQIDNPVAVPIGNNYSPYGIVAKATDIVNRGIILVNPDEGYISPNNDGTYNFDFDG